MGISYQMATRIHIILTLYDSDYCQFATYVACLLNQFTEICSHTNMEYLKFGMAMVV